MFHQTQAIEQSGGSGTVFFSSHDNWRQAVPPGEFNDPFRDEHPDDVRGFWEPSNKAKPELEMLTYLLSDVAVRMVDERVAPEATDVQILVSNRREHRLTDIALEVGSGEYTAIGELNPGESTVVALNAQTLRSRPNYPNVEFRFTHRSHAGLKGQSSWSVSVPDPSRGPVVADAKVFDLHQGTDRVAFTVLVDGDARIVVPDDWTSVLFGDELHPVVNGEVRLTLPSPTAPVHGLEMSRNGQEWNDFDGEVIGTGERYLRFRLPENRSESSTLIMSGLAARRVHFRWEDAMTSIDAHPYRETSTSLTGRSGDVTVRLRRRRPEYLTAAQSPTGESVPIHLSAPFVFDPKRLEVRRGVE